jgi:hypothetical protein
LGSKGIGRDDIVEGDGCAACPLLGTSPGSLARHAENTSRNGERSNMRRTIIAVLATLVIAELATTASAVWVESTARYIRRGYRRNIDWPWPFICPDRLATREPFEIMITNGWRRQNLLGGHHFDPLTNQLTTAGELQVRWIMTQAPPTRRQVYIERSIDPAITAARIVAARQFASQVTLDGQTPQVFESHLIAEGRPAGIVDFTNVKFMENMPAPVLPAATTDSTQ